MSSEPPEEPHFRIDANLLSPTSPKPIHFPIPSNIPVLENMMDVGFNQTEPHMNDPAMHNTEVRHDFWRDPHETPTASGEEAPSGQQGGETLETNVTATGDVETQSGPRETSAHEGADSMETTTTAEISESSPTVPNQSGATDGDVSADGVSEAFPASTVLSMPSEPGVPPVPDTASRPNLDASQGPLSETMGNLASGAHSLTGAVDVQALLNTLRTAPVTSTPADATAALADAANTAADETPQAQRLYSYDTLLPGEEGSTPLSASGLGVPPTGLPPRPPPQEQPLIHPNYVHSQHIRDYHPHAAHPAFQPHGRSGSQGIIADPATHSHVPHVHSPTTAAATVAPGATEAASTLVNSATEYSSMTGVNGHAFAASPASATALTSNQAPFTAQWAAAPGTEVQREGTTRETERSRPEDRPWDAEVQRKYDRFLEDERKYVSEGRWEQFPQGSRLFVGNLSSEKVTKRDIFHVFHCYGGLAQISIKQAYGFVQFLRTEDCHRALEAEQGTQIRDKRIHLEVSKPQKNRPGAGNRRSRSPADHNRGRSGGNVDRYVSGGSRGGENRGGQDRSGRNEYRPGYRSPSPRGYRDRYDDRFRQRSRSPGGYGRGGRNRSPVISPRRDEDDDLPLPRRVPGDVPDVQIIVLDSLDRDFISWVEMAFKSRGVRVDVLLLSPRLSEQAVVRRQILEGVVAVVKLTRQTQNVGKIGLQIFDRRQGHGNVKFEEYENLDPPICAELVLRAKGTHAPPAQAPAYGGYGMTPTAGASQYGAPGGGPGGYPQHQQQGSYGGQQPAMPSGYPPNYATTAGRGPTAAAAAAAAAPPPPQGMPPNLQSLITNLDPNNLQNLLSAMNTPQSAASYGGASAVLQQNPALAGYLQQQQQQQQQAVPPGNAGPGPAVAGQQINMQDILARLGTYQQ